MKQTKKTSNPAKAEITKLTNLIVVDASGSMIDKKVEVIGGLKQLFTKIQEDAKKDKKTTKTRTIVVDFSSPGDFRILVDSVDSINLDSTIAENYSTRGMTALFDAIGKGFNMVSQDQDSVFVNILTDGEENSSSEFSKPQITTLIKEKEGKGWIVTFMGTTKEAINQAKNIGIRGSNTFQFANSGAGGQSAMSNMSTARAIYYSNTKTLKSRTSSQKKDILTSMDCLMEEAAEETEKQDQKSRQDLKGKEYTQLNKND